MTLNKKGLFAYSEGVGVETVCDELFDEEFLVI